MRRFLYVLMALAATALNAAAQDFRGGITGRITDASGGRLPGVTVTATNVATNVASTTTTNNEGDFSILFLNPGTYSLSAELSGFKKVVRSNLEVSVGDRLGVDLSLEVGAIAETVSVTAESPMLVTTSGSTGQTIGEKTIAMMPLSDGNPFALARLAPGIAYTGDLKFSRPFDNAGTSGIVTGGATGGNEFSLDGSPNMASGRRVAFVPPAGAVQEFKVETASFDASSGHTAGATVNVTLKSGTNSLKGSAYTYYRSDKLAEKDFFVKKANAEKPGLSYNRPGFTFGGPVVLPGYDGHDKTFFFTAVEWLYDEFPEPLFQTVPTQAMRTGDFSALLAQGVVIYDPQSAAISSGTAVVRQPFAGNIIPANRINPIARNVLNYYPLPNTPADASGRNNFFYANPRTDDFYSWSTRFDHTVTAKQRLMGRYTKNDRREARGAELGSIDGFVPRGNFLFRKNDGITLNHTWTQSNSSLWEIRGGWQQFREPNVRQHEGNFDPASLGFSSNVVTLFGGAQYFPLFDFQTLSDIGDNLAGNATHRIYSVQPTYTKLAGSHSIRAGYDLRKYWESNVNPGRQAGDYTTTNGAAFTRQTNTSAAQNFQDVASFLTGYPTGGSIELNARRTNSQWYQAVFVQDDWKLSNRLTLNLGLRYDYEGAPSERDNGNVRGFDPTAMLSITSAAEAAYAARPDVIPASQWRARGGVNFASDSTPGFWNPDKNNIQPRLGFAYTLNELTVLRGGWGIYTSPFVFSNGLNQMGYSQSTPYTATQNNGLTFQSTLNNPYPNGVLQPAGNSLGPNTFLGQSVNRFMPVDGVQNTQLSRYIVNLQRQLPARWLLEVGYAGSRGFNIVTDEELNSIPAQYLSTSRVRDQATIDFLATNVPNPFAGGLLPTGFTGATVARSQLLRPFPQFNNVPTNGFEGSSQYDSFQTRIERRFSNGYSIMGTYTFSHFTDKVFRLNATNAEFEKRLARDDVPHRVTASILYELPFGKGRKFASDAGGVLEAIIGGWSVNAIGQFQSGRPLDFGGRNVYFNGDLDALKAKYTNNSDVPVFDISGFYFHDAAVQTNGVDDPVKQRNDPRINLVNNVRYFPSRIDGIRSPFLKLWDISLVKQVAIGGRVRAQFNVEFLNAFNVVVFNDANTDPRNADFGKVTSQNNLPRDIQLAAKIVW
jgi:hypothetical protein